MPREKPSAAGDGNPVESEKPEKTVEGEEQVDLDDPEEEEEEIEYEEVEEVEEEVEEEEEEVEEEEVEEEEEDDADANGNDAREGRLGTDREMKDALDDDESKKHAELLALPPNGAEVYVGGIPIEASEEDVRRFCETVGEVTEVRMMKGKDPRESRVYAFVTYRNKDLAVKAIKELNNSKLKDKAVKCSTSQAKHRLFVGNIPRSWGEDDIRKAVTEVGPGVELVELRKDPYNSSRNRGFAFVEYYNNACAEYSREKMSNPKFKLDKNAPTVKWADPKHSDTSSSSSQIKAVYIKNLPKNVTEDEVRDAFEHHGEITKVVLPPAKPGQERNRFGFVHYAERSSAMAAIKDTEKYEITGQVLECSLAKTQGDGKPASRPTPQKSAILPTYPPPMGYGMIGGAYGAVGGAYGAPGLAQPPLIYGRGPTPAGMAMFPMLLPDGRVGYVLQQPAAQPITPPQPRSGRSDNDRGSTGSRYGSGDRYGSSDRYGSNDRSYGSSGGRHSGGDNDRDRNRDRDRRYRPY